MKKKPTDHEILTALNEIIQESQKPKKVELSLVNDFNSAWAAGFRFIEKGNKELDEVKKTFTAAIREFENSLDASTKFEKAAKDLGVDVPEEITAKTKEAKEYIKEAKSKIK
jgi:hypothetical protein